MSSVRLHGSIAFLALQFLLSGCAYSIHEVHTSDFAPYSKIEQGEIVSAKAEQFVILGFTGNTDYVESAYAQIMSSCPKGTLSGITTQISTNLSFLSWTNVALMQGLCVNHNSKN
jgi:hypothetical protein